MAKRNQKSATLSAQQICHAAILAVLTQANSAQVESAGRAKSGVDAIVGLFGAYSDNLEAYVSAVFDVFGNDSKNPKKADSERGTLNVAMVAAGMPRTGGARTLFSMLRVVACAMPNEKMRTAIAEGSGINKLAKLARELLGRTTTKTTDAESGKVGQAEPASTEPKPIDARAIPDNVGMEWVKTHIDLSIGALRDFAIHAKDSIFVGRLSEIEIHMASKTTKTA